MRTIQSEIDKELNQSLGHNAEIIIGLETDVFYEVFNEIHAQKSRELDIQLDGEIGLMLEE